MSIGSSPAPENSAIKREKRKPHSEGMWRSEPWRRGLQGGLPTAARPPWHTRNPKLRCSATAGGTRRQRQQLAVSAERAEPAPSRDEGRDDVKVSEGRRKTRGGELVARLGAKSRKHELLHLCPHCHLLEWKQHWKLADNLTVLCEGERNHFWSSSLGHKGWRG